MPERLAGKLVEPLSERYPDVEWRAALVTDRLVAAPAGTMELIDAAHRLLLSEWPTSPSSATRTPTTARRAWRRWRGAARLRLLGGMVRANRPWRLAVHLYRSLVAALAVVAVALVTSDIWRISASLSPLRLTLIALLSILLTAGSLIAVHDLWARRAEGRANDQVMLFNAATTVTVALGILSLYGALVLLALGGAGLVITRTSRAAPAIDRAGLLPPPGEDGQRHRLRPAAAP